jgi:hypothetical protein
MPRRERPTDARRTPPQLVEKPMDEMTPGPGPARVRSGARHRRIKQRMLYMRVRRVTHLLALAPAPAPAPLFPSFTHPPLLPPRPRAARQPLPLSPRSLRARGGAGASAHALLGSGCARPNRGPGCGYARVLPPYTVAAARGLSLEVRSRSWVQEARYPSLELELAGANQDANGEDTPV